MPARIDKLWGSEEVLHNGPDYCCKILRISPGRESSLHYHRVKRETFVVVDGAVLLYRSSTNKFLRMMRGSSITLNPGDAHSFRSASEDDGATVFEASSEHREDDVVRIRESRIL